MGREPRFLLLATIVHGVILLALEASPRKRRPIERGPEPKSLEIDLDVERTPEPSSPFASAPEITDPARNQDAHRFFAPTPKVAVSVPAVPRDREQNLATLAPLEEPAPVAADDHADDLSSGPGYRTSSVDLRGARGGMSAILNPMPSGTQGEKGDKGAERAVRTSLREHDQKIGLGVSGPVVAAVEEIARTSTASVESHAVLDVVADGEGKIVLVSVSDASEDRAGWDGVARGLLAALRTKRVHVSPGSRGVAMTIAIDSREALPSGAAPGVNVSLLDAHVQSGKNARSASVSILPLAKIPVMVPVPGRPGVLEMKTIVLPVPLPSISGVFDLSDVAAPAARVIHARATSEREL